MLLALSAASQGSDEGDFTMTESTTCCTLCEQPIADYSAALHDLRLSDARTVRICDDCGRKIMTWQGEKVAALFPTRAMKRRQERRR